MRFPGAANYGVFSTTRQSSRRAMRRYGQRWLQPYARTCHTLAILRPANQPACSAGDALWLQRSKLQWIAYRLRSRCGRWHRKMIFEGSSPAVVISVIWLLVRLFTRILCHVIQLQNSISCRSVSSRLTMSSYSKDKHANLISSSRELRREKLIAVCKAPDK